MDLTIFAILSLFLASSSGWASNLSINNNQKIIYDCDFQSRHDLNADRQPDGWRRRRDRIHPAYISAEIVSRDAETASRAREFQNLLTRAYRGLRTGRWDSTYVPETLPPILNQLMDGVVVRNCYEVNIDGGAFELVSPDFAVDPRLSYRFEAEVSCTDLVSHVATIELHLLDRNGKTVEVVSTNPISGTIEWQKLDSSTIALMPGDEVDRGEIHLRVQPEGSGHGSGTVRFDNIRVQQLPRVSLTTNLPLNITRAGMPIYLNFEAIGLRSSEEAARLELLDVDSQVVFERDLPIERTELAGQYLSIPVSRDSTRLSKKERRRSETHNGQNRWTNSRAECHLSMDQIGYYRIRVSLGNQFQAETPVVVLGHDRIEGGPFGWNLTNLDSNAHRDNLIEMIGSLGISRVKIPIWFDHRDSPQLEPVSRLISRLRFQEIKCIGLMDRPKNAPVSPQNEETRRVHPIAAMSEPQTWRETIEPVLTTLGMKIDWLQFGPDDDRSLATNPALRKNLTDIRDQIQGFGHDCKLAIGWDWREPVDTVSNQAQQQIPAWNALHFTTDPQFSAEELYQNAKALPKANWQTWASIHPLGNSKHSLSERTVDLVQKMIAVRRTDIHAAFASHTFDDEFGIFDSDHRAGPLLLPWANVAQAIATRRYSGSMDLRSGSKNNLFESDAGTVMILWNDQPVKEQVFLGKDIQVKDIWGRSVTPTSVPFASGSVAHEIPVGDWPLIISHIDKNVVKWQQEFELLVNHLSSQIVDGGTFKVNIHNPYGLTASGKLLLYASSLFEDGSVVLPFELPADGSSQFDVPFTFLPDASAGLHPIEFAFQIHTDQEYRLSIRREVQLGHRDLRLTWKMVRLNDQFVEVQVELTNDTTGPVSFDCKLFPPRAAYQRVQIIDAAVGTTIHTHRLMIPKNASRDSSSVWVRCEQIGEPVILNYRLSE